MCPLVYHHNRFVTTHALGTWCTVKLNKLSKEHNISGQKWSTTRRVLKSHRSKMSIIYMLSWKQCTLLVITAMAFWQFMYFQYIYFPLSADCGIHFEWRISDFRFQIESWPKSDLKSQPCAFCATGSNHWAIWQNNELWDVLNGLQDQGTTKLNI